MPSLNSRYAIDSIISLLALATSISFVPTWPSQLMYAMKKLLMTDSGDTRSFAGRFTVLDFLSIGIPRDLRTLTSVIEFTLTASTVLAQ